MLRAEIRRSPLEYRMIRRKAVKAVGELEARLSSFITPLLRPGSTNWLIAKEQRYGGYVLVKILRVSPHDRGAKERLERSPGMRMIGGDRMSRRRHGYAPHYSKHLRRFIGSRPVCVEVGILRGTGLAIWSDLFPKGKIFGLDIDLSHFENNKAYLCASGAFKAKNVSTHEFDLFDCSDATFSAILNGRKIDIMIDDAYHTIETITNTLVAARPHLAKQFVYFIEDNDSLSSELLQSYFGPDVNIERRGLLSIISRD